MAKSCNSVFLASKFLFVLSYTFAVGYLLATNYTEKNESKKTRMLGPSFFWDRQSGVHWSCYVLLFTDFVNFVQSCLSWLSLGAFIVGSCVSAVRQLVTETGLIVCQNTARRRQYDRLSQQQLSFLLHFTGGGKWPLWPCHWIPVSARAQCCCWRRGTFIRSRC